MNIKKITAAVMAVTILAGMTACSDTANETAEVSETTTVVEDTTTTAAETTTVAEETTAAETTTASETTTITEEETTTTVTEITPSIEKAAVQEYHYLNEDVAFDLDGDGVQEQITYKYLVDSDGEISDFMKILNVNGVEYQNGYGYDKYLICDLDPTDNYVEIAMSTSRNTNDSYTEFLRYTDGELKYLGKVSDSVSAEDEDATTFELSKLYGAGESLVINDDGTIKASKRLSIFQTWFAYTSYKLNPETCRIEEIVPDIYYPYGEELKDDYATVSKMLHSGNYKQTSTSKTLSLYSEMSQDSSLVTLEPQNIVATATDNENRVYIVGESGVSGWVYCDSNLTFINPDTGESCSIYAEWDDGYFNNTLSYD